MWLSTLFTIRLTMHILTVFQCFPFQIPYQGIIYAVWIAVYNRYTKLSYWQTSNDDRIVYFLVNFPFKMILMCSLCTSWLQRSASVVNMIKAFKLRKKKKKSYAFFSLLFCLEEALLLQNMMENTWSYRTRSLHSLERIFHHILILTSFQTYDFFLLHGTHTDFHCMDTNSYSKKSYFFPTE